MTNELPPGGSEREFGPGDVVVLEGDQADVVHVVEAGSVRVIAGDDELRGVLNTLGSGDLIGDVAAFTGEVRSATAVALEPTTTRAIPVEEFVEWAQAEPARAAALLAEARRRVDRRRAMDVLIPLFGLTEPAQVAAVLDQLGWQHLAAGDTLFRAGEAGDAAYLVVGGRIAISAEDRSGEVGASRGGARRDVGRGELVGAHALIDGEPRDSTAIASRDSTLAVISHDTFRSLLAAYPELGINLARSVLGGRRHGSRSARAASIALLVVGDAADGPRPHELGAVEAAFAEELARIADVAELTSASVESMLGIAGIAAATAGDPSVPQLTELLRSHEARCEYLVLRADREATPWTRRALAGADRVVVIVRPNCSTSELDAARSALDAAASPLAHRLLAVVHPPSAARPARTAALIARLGADSVVHLRAGEADDVARLARLAAGRGVALVLSGGGARGFAHLGVLRALREHGVPVDVVAGTSIGAAVGAAIAQGLSPQELRATMERQFDRLLDYTVPAVSLLKGKRISDRIVETFGEWEIEDLWRRFVCVSTNITSGQRHVHRSGPLATAVRASVAIPGVLPPVVLGDELLVDGGVLDNFPVGEVIADPLVGTIVAVDVAPSGGPRADADHGMSVSGGRVIVDRMLRRRSYPSAGAIIVRTMLAGSVSHRQQAGHDDAVDLLVNLDLPGVGLLEFDRLDDVELRGYDGSVEQVAAWAAR